MALALLVGSTSAYPDPDSAPGRYSSPCLSQHERRFVFDYAEALEAADGQAVEALACNLYASTGIHFATVAVRDTEGEPIDSYALHVFEAWGIGDKQRLDGVLLLGVTPQEEDLEARIEVGYALEDRLTAVEARRILDSAAATRQDALAGNATPAEARSQALLVAAQGITARLTPTDAPVTAPPRRPLALHWTSIGAILLGLVAVAGTAYYYRHQFRRPRNEWGDVEHTALDYFIAGARWRSPSPLDPDLSNPRYRWFKRGQRWRYVGLILYAALLVLRRAPGKRIGGRFGGGRSGGGGFGGRL